MKQIPYTVYIVRCANKTLYTGTARDLKKRLHQHNTKTGAKYTRAFGPVKLLWSQKKKNRSLACKLESEIKSWSRTEKSAWIRSKRKKI